MVTHCYQLNSCPPSVPCGAPLHIHFSIMYSLTSQTDSVVSNAPVSLHRWPLLMGCPSLVPPAFPHLSPFSCVLSERFAWPSEADATCPGFPSPSESPLHDTTGGTIIVSV